MRAQCCICSDLFTQEDGINIAAAPCGHTFHEACILKWLDQSSTCPRCRCKVNKSKIINRLYFDRGDDEDVTKGENPEQLLNQIHDLKSKVGGHQREKSKLSDEVSRLSLSLEQSKEETKYADMLVQKEQTECSAMRKQLKYYAAQDKAVCMEREEYRKSKKKMADLRQLQTLLTGSEADTKSILSLHTDGEGSVKQLAMAISVLKREYETVKSEKKLVKDELDKRKREMFSQIKELRDKADKVKSLQEQLAHSEEDLKHSEKEKDILKMKLGKLKKAMQSPMAVGSSSFIEAIVDENIPCYTPVILKCPEGNFDLESIPKSRLSFSPDIVNPSPITQLREKCKENNIKYVKITSAAGPAKKKKRLDDEEIDADVPTLGQFNLLKKKKGLSSAFTSAVRKGYDGLGGHTTFSQPTRPPKQTGFKIVTAKSFNTKSVSNNPFKLPMFPRLGEFEES